MTTIRLQKTKVVRKVMINILKTEAVYEKFLNIMEFFILSFMNIVCGSLRKECVKRNISGFRSTDFPFPKLTKN
jgi:hypothetical protein